MRRRIVLAGCLVLWCASVSFAQEAPGGSWFMRTGFAPGYVFIKSAPFPQAPDGPGGEIHWVPDATIEIGRQTDGTQPWHHLYGLPSYGFGFSVARFRAGAARGLPTEAYAFFSWPLWKLTERADVTTDFGMGLSWNWQPNYTAGEPDRSAFRANLNALIDWGIYLRYRAARRTSVYGGIDFTHRSNAGLVQPSFGVNVIGPKVAVRYQFGPETSPARGMPPADRTAFRPAWNLIVGGAGGLKNVTLDDGESRRDDFGVFHAMAAVDRRLYPFGGVGLGMDITADSSTGIDRGADGAGGGSRADVKDRWALGLYAGYEHVIGRFSPFVHVGYEVARAFPNGARPRLYQRFGWRFRINEHLWSTLAIRTIDVNKADFIEAGFGYRTRLFRGHPERSTQSRQQ